MKSLARFAQRHPLSSLSLVVVIISAALFGIKLLTAPSPQPVAVKAAAELSADEYQKVRDDYLATLNSQNPKVVLADLRERIKTDDSLGRSCHALAHDMGHAAYQKYRDFGQALTFQDELCNSGYLHGIIESHFDASPDVFAAMQTVCDPYPMGKFLSWECFHGVGHGLMYYTDNDLPASLDYCRKYSEQFARRVCSGGVFMENFSTDQKIHTSAYLKESDPFYPCDEQAVELRGDCYVYTPTYYLGLHKNDYYGALKWCQTAPNEYRDNCVTGVGSQALKENINSPGMVEEICSRGTSMTSACIKGMAGLFINHSGSLEEPRRLCGQLREVNQGICQEVLQDSRF